MWLHIYVRIEGNPCQQKGIQLFELSYSHGTRYPIGQVLDLIEKLYWSMWIKMWTKPQRPTQNEKRVHNSCALLCIQHSRKHNIHIYTSTKTNCWLELGFQRVDHHTGGRWLMHGINWHWYNIYPYISANAGSYGLNLDTVMRLSSSKTRFSWHCMKRVILHIQKWNMHIILLQHALLWSWFDTRDPLTVKTLM